MVCAASFSLFLELSEFLTKLYLLQLEILHQKNFLGKKTNPPLTAWAAVSISLSQPHCTATAASSEHLFI